MSEPNRMRRFAQRAQETARHERAIQQETERSDQSSGRKQKQLGSQTAMKRAAQPEEIAPAFVFMAAPSCSSYITGEILPIIGGYTGG
jgi:NAD(P)-dependent dehydrogenase (short-subunit alcohol dehydrogenase family)